MHVEWGEGCVGGGRTVATDQGMDQKSGAEKERERHNDRGTDSGSCFFLLAKASPFFPEEPW